MQISKPTITIILDTRRVKKASSYPVKLRVTFLREQKHYSLGLDLSEKEFELTQNSIAFKSTRDTELKRKVSQAKLKIETVFVKACEVAAKLDEFTFNLFEKRFFQQELSLQDVYECYASTINTITGEGRVGTAANYQCSMNSLKKFSPKLKFRDITAEFLKKYERHLLQEGKSITTVGVYLRPLRAVFNGAIADGIVSRDALYPFGKRQYQIPATRNVKKALTKADIKKFIDFEPLKGTWWDKAKDIFLFSYLSNGMNMKDILLLKRKNVESDYIRFMRAKTLNTHKGNNTPISIFISPALQEIIDKWGIEKGDGDDFIFPFIPQGVTPEKERLLIKQFTKMVNKYILSIAKQVKIEKKVTTYYARHSFATILKKGGSSIELIRESLGHSSSRTTAIYLDSFDDDIKEGISKMLLDFS